MNVALAQKFLAGKHMVIDSTLYLRWVPSDYDALQAIIKDSIVIERIKWQTLNIPTDNDFKNPEYISSTWTIPKTDLKWKKLLKEKKETALLFNVLFSFNFRGDPNIPFGLAMLQCDIDSSLALAAGLFSKLKMTDNQEYCYRIRLKKGKNITPAKILVNHASKSSLANIDSLRVKTSRQEIQLIWKDSLLMNDYGSYNIERSENNSPFIRINESPVIKITTKEEKKKNYVVFNDTSFQYNTAYRYRISGRTFFGMNGPYSNTVTALVPKPITLIPSLDSAVTIHDTACRLIWHFSGTKQASEISSVKIFRSSKEQINYSIIATLSGTTYVFTDPKPFKNSYYKLAVYNLYGDSAISNNIMFCRPDVKPPHAPQKLQGAIDTSGNVSLYWKANSDKDLLGYRVFRCNALTEDKIEVTTKILKDTVFNDKIDLQTLSTHIYYAITAVDFVYNNSDFSNTLSMRRPDKIPPVPAKINTVLSKDKGVSISILKSSSKDVKQYTLLSVIDSLEREIIRFSCLDTTSFIRDTSYYPNAWIHYKLITEDSTGNKSMYVSKSIYIQKLPQNIIDFNFKVFFDRKSILLSWSELNNVFSYTIYKAKNNEPYIAFRTFKNNCCHFEDYSLNIGNEYRYKLKILFNDGSEMYYDKPLIIDF